MFLYFILPDLTNVFNVVFYTNFIILLFLFLPVLSFNNYTPKRINSSISFSNNKFNLLFFYKI